MPVLPIPMIFALILFVLLLRALLRRSLGLWLALLLAVAAVQSALVALVHHYEVAVLRPLMPICAACLPPLSWGAFVVTTQRPLVARDLAHLAPPVGAALALLWLPAALDPYLILLFLGYGVAMGWRLSAGRDSLARLGLASGDLPWQLWALVATVLVASAISDIWVWVDFVRWQGAHVPMIVGLFSALNLLTLGAVSLAPVVSEAENAEDSPNADAAEVAQVLRADPETDAAALFARLDQRMREEALFLDPDLSLQRLARKLGVPVKRLSAAVNACTGENVSRYVNGHRVARAATLLSQGANATEAMFAAGFNTKSNFNREFRRIKGVTPTQWRDEGRAMRPEAGGSRA